MDKEQIIEILLDAQIIDRYVEDSEINGAVDEILALHREACQAQIQKVWNSWGPPDYAGIDPVKWKGVPNNAAHRPNCLPIVYGRTEDPAKCICHSWRGTEVV